MPIDACPLCNSNLTEGFQRDSYREYLKCSNCDFVFVSKIYHLSEKDEGLDMTHTTITQRMTGIVTFCLNY